MFLNNLEREVKYCFLKQIDFQNVKFKNKEQKILKLVKQTLNLNVL